MAAGSRGKWMAGAEIGESSKAGNGGPSFISVKGLGFYSRYEAIYFSYFACRKSVKM